MKGSSFGIVLLATLLLASTFGRESEAGAISVRPFQPLESLKGKHPRILLNPARIEELRRSVRTESLAKLHFGSLVKWFDQRIAKGSEPVYAEPKTDYWEGLELRNVGEEMVGMAFLFRMTGEPRYLDAARRWALSASAFPKWGKFDRRGYTINDLGGSTLQFGLALVYDWLHDDLSEADRRALREALVAKTREVYQYAAVRKEAFWVAVPMHNHNWINTGGVFTVGLALYGEVEDAPAWIDFAVGQYEKAYASYFEKGDGASHEGFAYWDYGTKKITLILTLMKELLGIDRFENNGWLRNTVDFAIHSSLPSNGWKSREVRKKINGEEVVFDVPIENGITFGDGPRRTWGIPTSYMLRLSGLYRDGNARWYAERTAASGTETRGDQWMEVLWDDPSVKAEAPTSRPLEKHFSNLGLVIARSSWDGSENVSAFKCGPPGGHAAVDFYAEHPGTGHSAPDAGSFQIYAYSDWLVVGPGYAEKFTAYQNTLLVNGKGQVDEGKPYYWANGFFSGKLHPGIVRCVPVSNGIDVVAKVEDAYPKEIGLKKFRRHFLYRRPALWVIVDDWETERESILETSLHSDFPFVGEADRWVAKGPRATLVVRSRSTVPSGSSSFFRPMRYVQAPKDAPAGLQALVTSNERPAKKGWSARVLMAFPSGETVDDRVEFTLAPSSGEEGAVRVGRSGASGGPLKFLLVRDAAGDLRVLESGEPL